MDKGLLLAWRGMKKDIREIQLDSFGFPQWERERWVSVVTFKVWFKNGDYRLVTFKIQLEDLFRLADEEYEPVDIFPLRRR